MVLWKFVRREIVSRPGRATLTLLSIVIGVAAVVAVQISTVTTREAALEMFQSVTGRAAFEIDAGPQFVDQDLAAAVEKVAGVEAAVPVLRRRNVPLYHEGKRLPLMVLGIDPVKDKIVRDYELAGGTFFGEPGVMLEASLAGRLKCKIGDEVKLMSGRGRILRFPIVGLLSSGGAAGFNQGGVVFMPLDLAQSTYAARGKINAISVVLKPGANEEQVRGEVLKLLPAGLSLETPATRTQLYAQTMLDLEKGLNAVYVLMIALAMIMILNTFLMNLGERRRQLAIMRAIGTLRDQLMKMLLLEAIIMGVSGTIVGSILGVLGATAMSRSMAEAYSTAAPAVRLTAGPFIVAGILGPGMSLIAMLIPALLSTRISPLEGMRPAIAGPSSRLSWRSVALCIGLFCVSGGLLYINVLGLLPAGWVIYTGISFTLAMVLLILPALGPLARTASFILAPLLRTEGRIAGRQVVRRRTRTTLTIGILYVSLAMCIGIGTQMINSINDVRTWYKQVMVGDFFVRAMQTNLSTGEGSEIPESIGAEIRGVAGVTGVDSSIFLPSKIGETECVIAVHDFADPDYLPLQITSGPADNVRQAMLDGQVVLGSALAKKLDQEPGGEIALNTAGGLQKVRIAALVKDYVAGGLVVHIARPVAKRLLGVEGVFVYMVKVGRKAQLDEVAKRLNAIADEHGILVVSQAEASRALDVKLNGIVALLWGIMIMGFIVCAFAIANTLTMNVLEQTRDLALLRVVAMTRAQVRKTVMAQALVIGAIGIATGVGGGAVGAFFTNSSSARLMGHSVDFSFQPMLLLVAFLAGLVVTVTAAFIPAIRASRLNLLIALQYE